MKIPVIEIAVSVVVLYFAVLLGRHLWDVWKFLQYQRRYRERHKRSTAEWWGKR